LSRAIHQDVTKQIFQGAGTGSNLQTDNPAIFLNWGHGFAIHILRSTLAGRIEENLIEAAPHDRPGRIRNQGVGLGTAPLYFHPKRHAVGVVNVETVLARIFLSREARLELEIANGVATLAAE